MSFQPTTAAPMTKYILEYFLSLKWKLHSLACIADSLEGLHPDCSSSSSRETYPVATQAVVHCAVVLNCWLCLIHPSFIQVKSKGT